jgi:hypothetical protein
MNGKHLKQVHLAMLSPVMHAYGKPFIRKTQFKPIQPAHIGLGSYESTAQTIAPRSKKLWSDLYRVGVAGSLSKVTPFGPSAFGEEGDPDWMVSEAKMHFIIGAAAATAATFVALKLLKG